MSKLKYWLWLAHLNGLGTKSALRVLDHFGSPELAYFADRTQYGMVEHLSKREIEALGNKSLDEASRILDDCYRLNIQIITLQDAAYPERLKNIDTPPPALYVKGHMLPFDSEVTVAVVGARKASAYGLLAAKKMGYQIGRCGGVVVSGMAAGIDGKAHEGALSAGAVTAAVLGCGVDVIYPYENRRLYEDIVSVGALISEYPPGTPAYGQNFPIRNRIISGLSLGVVVVEAPKKSGSLITASHALEQGRDVFAVPGNIDTSACEGSNKLIQDGAVLVTSGWDVVREYAALYPGKINNRAGGVATVLDVKIKDLPIEKSEEKVASPTIKMEASDKKVIDKSGKRAYIDLQEVKKDASEDECLILDTLSEKARHVDDIIDMTQLPAARVLASLTLLEVKGIVSQLPGKRFSLMESGQ